MMVQNVFYDRQSKACAATFAAAPRVDPVKAFS
jgi:hypothetical protein